MNLYALCKLLKSDRLACTKTLLIMKFTALYLLAFCLQVSAKTHSQKITLREKNAPLEKIFIEIRKQSGFEFIYNTNMLSSGRRVDVQVKNAHVKDVLEICFKNQPFSYTIINNTIIVKPQEKRPEKVEVVDVFIDITGKVANEKGEPLQGVSVSVKGTNKIVATDAAGVYSISAERGNVLQFSYVGYVQKEVTVQSDQSINVTLQLENAELNTVVVTALGIRKQARSLGYATTEVDGAKLTASRETNLGNALTGQVAGVSVAGIATGPYGSSRVVIRGNASLKGSSQPLYVIDGVPFDNTNQGSPGPYGGVDFGDGLSTINPDDIESIQVLKGVAASALYGYRGGNGAILITTKSGARSKGIGIEVNNNLTFTSVNDQRDYQYVYGQGYQGNKPTTAYGSSSSAQAAWGAKLDGSQTVNIHGEATPYVAYKDNFKNFYKTGLSNQSSVALSGSNEKGNFRLGLSNLYLKPVLPNSNMKQQGVNFNGSFWITPKLKMSLNANYVFEKVKNRASLSDAPGNAIAGTLFLANSFDIRWLEKAVDPDGTEMLPNVDDIYFNNPYFIAYHFLNETNRNRLTGGLTLKYDITKWLSAQAQVTRDGYTVDKNEVFPTGTEWMLDGGVHKNNTDFRELNGGFTLFANKQFGDISLAASVGGNSQDNISKNTYAGGWGLVVPYFYDISNVSNINNNYSYKHFRVNSLFGSADLGYKNFLFLTLTARNDWYSTLNINTNDRLYPSVSSSFIFSDVINLPSWISFGKLRASYGQASNGTEPYRNLLTYGLQPYNINGQPLGYISQTEIPNNFLKPVKIKEQEIGVNLQFLNSRLGVDVAVYNKRTEDDILPVGTTTASGYLGNIVNIGKLRNRGVELLLTGTPIRTSNFNWNVSFNYAVNNSEVLELTGGEKEVPLGGDDYPRFGEGVSIKHIVGMPYAQIVGCKYKRNDAGSIVFDADGIPMRNDEPEALGSAMYKTTGGLSNDLNYRNFNLSFLFDFKYGAKIYSGTNLLLYSSGLHKVTLEGREGGYVGNGVTEDNKQNTVKVPSQTYFSRLAFDNHVTEEFVYDASFIKLRSLSIGYSLPQSFIRNSFIKGLTLSLVGRNLAIIKKHTPNIDPESNLNNSNAQGLELSGYPSVRTVGFNLNAKF